MVQIQRVLERALKGKYESRIKLRTDDYLHEIAEDINLLLEKLDQESKENKNEDDNLPASTKEDNN